MLDARGEATFRNTHRPTTHSRRTMFIEGGVAGIILALVVLGIPAALGRW